jgi:hypothetical protein
MTIRCFQKIVEQKAFRAQGRPEGCVLLVDADDILISGSPNAIGVGKKKAGLSGGRKAKRDRLVQEHKKGRVFRPCLNISDLQRPAVSPKDPVRRNPGPARPLVREKAGH